MKRVMIALVVAVLLSSPAAAMDCGHSGEAGTQAWLDSCLFALADDSAFGPMKPFGPNWIVAGNQPCQLYNSNPVPKESVTWSGGCVDGKAHGEGRGEWRVPRGGAEVYVGPMRAGYVHGRGVSTWPDGNRYEGDFVDGKKHGRGVFTWADGSRYEGDWRDDELTGRGVFTRPDGTGYEGEWRNDRPHGYGSYISASGDRFEGQWRNGCFERKDGEQAWIGVSREECGF